MCGSCRHCTALAGSHTVTVTNYAKNASEPLHKHALNSTLAHRTRTHVKLRSRGVRCVCVVMFCYVVCCFGSIVHASVRFGESDVWWRRARWTQKYTYIYTHTQTHYIDRCVVACTNRVQMRVCVAPGPAGSVYPSVFCSDEVRRGHQHHQHHPQQGGTTIAERVPS